MPGPSPSRLWPPESGASFLFGHTTMTRLAGDTEGASRRSKQIAMLRAASTRPSASTAWIHPWASHPRHPNVHAEGVAPEWDPACDATQHLKNHCYVNYLEPLRPAKGYGE